MTSIEPPSGPERAYLDAFRETNAMPDAARERVWARLSGGPVGPVGGQAANDAGPLLAAAGGGGRAWWNRSGLLLGASAAVVAGVMVLALRDTKPEVEQPAVELVVASEEPPVEPVVDRPTEPIQVIAPAEAPSQPAPSEAEIQPSEPKQPIVERSRKRARARPELPAQTSSLADERRLIERTHAALAKGEIDVALSLLGRHAVEFEAGVFVEEREALVAVATCTAGRLDEGRTAARNFLANYPQAVLAARVRSSCALGD